MLSAKYDGRLVCQTGHTYSNTGLITDKYILSRSSCVIPERFNWYNKYTRLLALDTILSMWTFHVKFSVNVTPRILIWSTRSMTDPSILRQGNWARRVRSLVKFVTISLVLLALSFISLATDHWCTKSAYSCSFEGSFREHTSVRVPSSTYLWRRQSALRSLM